MNNIRQQQQMQALAANPYVERIQLKDADGEFHSYIIEPFPGSEGFKVGKRILAAVARASLPALFENMGELEGLFGAAKNKAAMNDTSFLEEMQQSIDLRALGQDIPTVIEEFPDVLVQALLKYVMRDGKPLSQRSNMDEAFRRNYAELYTLLYEVVRVNRFVPFPESSSKNEEEAVAAPSPQGALFGDT